MLTGKDNKTTAADNMTNEGGNTLDGVKEPRGYSRIEEAIKAEKENWGQSARQTGHHVRELADTARHSLSDAGGSVALRIRDNPIQSSIIALGLGLIFGMIYRR